MMENKNLFISGFVLGAFILIIILIIFSKFTGFSVFSIFASKNSKIEVCHIPPGNPNNAHTIVVDDSAWPAHQAHGDYKGICRDIDAKSLKDIENSSKSLHPILVCVTKNGENNYTAYFGYENDNGEAVRVNIGSRNKFAPNPENREQPVVFKQGKHDRAFEIEFDGKGLLWILNGRVSISSKNAVSCADSNVTASNETIISPDGIVVNNNTQSDLAVDSLIINVNSGLIEGFLSGNNSLSIIDAGGGIDNSVINYCKARAK